MSPWDPAGGRRFRSTGYRAGRCRFRHRSHPDALARGCGARAGQTNPSKTATPAYTRPGVFRCYGACQGSGPSSTNTRDRFSSHCARVTRVVQRDCSWPPPGSVGRSKPGVVSGTGSTAQSPSGGHTSPRSLKPAQHRLPNRLPRAPPAAAPAPDGSLCAPHRRSPLQLPARASGSSSAAEPAASTDRGGSTLHSGDPRCLLPGRRSGRCACGAPSTGVRP
jgi:hypothetical protein